jgi:hypothetical protein
MAESSEKIKIVEVSRLADGDALITFSDETVVLFHAKFLYEMRGHDGNVEIVDPFEK